jgi:hypothetical protein
MLRMQLPERAIGVIEATFEPNHQVFGVKPLATSGRTEGFDGAPCADRQLRRCLACDLRDNHR